MRFNRTAAVLAPGVAVLMVSAAVAAFLPGSATRAAAWAVVATVIALPLLRVALLAAVWWRERDTKYAAYAVALLLIVGVGAAVAIVR